MTTPVVSSTPTPFNATIDEGQALVTRAYRTKTSFVAVYFPEPGKGQIVFLPKEGTLRVLGPSSCLPEGFEVLFENHIYNVFAIDLLARSSLLHEPVDAECHSLAVCA